VVPGSRGKGPDVLAGELERELLGARLIANLATLDRDGTVHVVPMWFAWEDGELLMPTNHRTRKVRNLERDPRATVMIDDSRAGFDLRGIALSGRARIEGGEDARLVNRRIHLRYVTERGRELPAVDSYLATDDVTIRLRPDRVRSWNLRETDAGRALAQSGEFRRLGDAT
jgi:PPOX class probable F420-dependent enzyme